MMMHLKRKRKQIMSAVRFLVATACVVTLLFPIYWMIISSFKTDGEIFATVPTFFPKHWTLRGYEKMFLEKASGQSVLDSIINSIYISMITCVISVLLATTSAYGIARFSYRINKVILLVFLIAQMMPSVLFLAPLYLMFKQAGLIGTHLAPSIFVTLHSVPFSVLMLRPYFLGIPGELEQSAVIDGCNVFQAFYRIMLPMVYPGVVVIGVLSFLWGWGDLVGALTFASMGDMRPLSLNMYRAMASDSIDWAMLMAFATVIVVPATILFLSLQRFIVSGLTSGAVKG
jgi:multiple sugar transport system permease protein